MSETHQIYLELKVNFECLRRRKERLRQNCVQSLRGKPSK